MKIVKHVCKKCKKVELAKTHDLIFLFIKTIFVYIGIFALIFFFITWSRTGELGLTGNQVFTSVLNLKATATERPDIRQFILENTDIEYCQSDKYCYLEMVYDYMTQHRSYVYSLTINDPMYTLTENGQCSNFAYTYAVVLRQFQINVKIMCNKTHCWNEVKGVPTYDELGNKQKVNLFIDVTNDNFKEVE